MDIFQILLYAHITTGFAGLILGTITAIRKKSDKVHKRTGYWFHISMLLASSIAIPMSYLHSNLFLFLVSVFTIYSLITGKRYIQKTKKPEITKYDWFISSAMGAFGSLFVGFGIFLICRGSNFGIVAIVFGSLSLLGVLEDWKNFTGRSKFKNCFLTSHINRMTGGYIAPLTAFLVVNNSLLPDILAWLLPTLVMTPVIYFWTKKHAIPKN